MSIISTSEQASRCLALLLLLHHESCISVTLPSQQSKWQRGDDLGDQSVQVGVGRTFDVQVPAANVVKRLIVLTAAPVQRGGHRSCNKRDQPRPRKATAWNVLSLFQPGNFCLFFNTSRAANANNHHVNTHQPRNSEEDDGTVGGKMA